MFVKNKNGYKRLFNLGKILAISSAIILAFMLANKQLPITPVNAHSSVAFPKEIFSLWNDIAPTIDGAIAFSPYQLAAEWSAAAVYDMVDDTGDPKGKLLLQNSDDSLFIAMDMISFQTGLPSAPWGCAVYLDINHDGFLTSVDRSIRFLKNSSGEFVEFLKPNTKSNDWVMIESGVLGTPLVGSGILLDTAFTTSAFNRDDDHRQYEIKLPLLVLASGPGGIRGVGFEATDAYPDNNAGITWPYISDTPNRIRESAGTWGDLHLGIDCGDCYVRYAVEKNINIKATATGYNNGTFFATGDIDGDDDLELIVSSNRTVTGDNNLLAIFDYVGGEFTRIWSSWKTSHQSKMFLVRGVATHDFDRDGKDEIYTCGQNSRILRFYSWNATSQDFDHSEYAFTHSAGLMGYIAINDADNDGEAEIVCGDQNGEVITLFYDSSGDDFDHEKHSPFTPPKIDGSYPYRIHAVEVADMDDDGLNELLILSQITSDNSLSTTRLQIFEWNPGKYHDNNEENDLPKDSSITTEDHFGHSIIVADVDNDLENETIIVGRDYLKIFGKNSFSSSAPPLQLSLNDGSSIPKMAGGAAVADLDGDDTYELIFGANNGTIFVGEVTTKGPNSLSFDIEWSGDFGSSPGKREAIVLLDLDQDGKTELIIGDNFGQMLVLGQGESPELSISSPSSGYISGMQTIIVWWDTTENLFPMHHYDVYVNGFFVGRAGGGQSGFLVKLFEGVNKIQITGYDISGKSDSDSIQVEYTLGAPQVTITRPQNLYPTSADSVTINYLAVDSEGNLDHYEIYRNDSQIEDYTTNTTYTVFLPSNGRWNISVIAVDQMNKKGRDSIVVVRDTTAPEITITSPVDGSAVKEPEIELKWIASDDLTTINHFEIKKDGYFYASTTLNAYVVNLDLNKEYLLEVTAFDEVGNFGTDMIIITRDTVKPEVAIAPLPLPQMPDNTYYTGSSLVTLSWNATDNLGGTGIIHSEITVNDQLIDSYPTSMSNTTIDLGGNGIKELTLTSYDRAGNSATDYLTVIIDTTDPIIEITIPPENNYTTGFEDVIISWESSDIGTGIKEYIIWIDGEKKEVIFDPEETFYHASIPEKKTYTITVQANDFLNQSSEDTISVTHDPSAPALAIANPVKLYSYSRFPTLDLSWESINLDVERFDVYVNGSLINSYPNNIKQATIDFGSIPINEFPLYNLTICAVEQESILYKNFRWILVDQTIPEVSIISPTDQDIILDENLHVEWTGEDLGSGIRKYTLKFNNELICILSSEVNSQYINITGADGFYNLTVVASDGAGNFATVSIQLQISLILPEFETNLPRPFITNTGIFQFNLTVTNTRFGVRELAVFADEKQVFSNNFRANIKHQPFWYIIDISEEYFGKAEGKHNLTISVVDKAFRESIKNIDIYIDLATPDIVTPIFDTQLLGTSPTEFELFDEEGTNNHNLTVTFRDAYGILGVNVTILGKNLNQTFQMNFAGKKEQDTYEYNLTINFDDFTAGDYMLVFTAVDLAGNYYTNSYNITLIRFHEPPWVLQGNNFLLVTFGIFLTLILTIVLIVAAHKPIINRGWRDEIEAMAYIMKSGVTVAYVPYSPNLIADNQFFGGAIAAIRGILEEITSEEDIQFKVRTVEFDDKQLLIHSGKYGEAILLVQESKPLLEERLKQFTVDFERRFKSQLSESIIVLSDFNAAPVIVESYFGVPKSFVQEQVFELSKSVPREKSFEPIKSPPKEGLITPRFQEAAAPPFEEKKIQETLPPIKPHRQFSVITKVLIDKTIDLTKKALYSLLWGKLDEANSHILSALKSLEIIIHSDDPFEDTKLIIEVILKILRETHKAVIHGRKGEQEEMRETLEKASKLFYERLLKGR